MNDDVMMKEVVVDPDQVGGGDDDDGGSKVDLEQPPSPPKDEDVGVVETEDEKSEGTTPDSEDGTSNGGSSSTGKDVQQQKQIIKGWLLLVGLIVVLAAVTIGVLVFGDDNKEDDDKALLTSVNADTNAELVDGVDTINNSSDNGSDGTMIDIGTGDDDAWNNNQNQNNNNNNNGYDRPYYGNGMERIEVLPVDPTLLEHPPFVVEDLPLLNADRLVGYTSMDELRNDLTLAAQHIVNEVVQVNLQNLAAGYYDIYCQYDGHGGCYDNASNYLEPAEDDAVFMEEEEEEETEEEDMEREEEEEELREEAEEEVDVEMVQPVGGGGGRGDVAATTRGSTPVAATTAAATATPVKDHKTNNQEDTADEADFIKADDHYVYAAYGNYFVVWDRHDGTIITKMDLPEQNDQHYSEANGSDGQGSNCYRYGGSNPRIQSILLTDDHVVLVVTKNGYTNRCYDDTSRGSGSNGDGNGNGPEEEFDFTQLPLPTTSILTNHHRLTELQVYLKPNPDDGSNPNISLVAKQNMHGRFRDGRVMDVTHSIELVSGIELDITGYLQSPLEFRHYQTNDPTIYYNRVVSYANTTLIPNFVNAMIQELTTLQQQGNDDEESDVVVVPTMLQINSWLTTTGNDEDDNEPEEEDEPVTTTTTTNANDPEEQQEQPIRQQHYYWGMWTPSVDSVRTLITIQSISIDQLPTTTTAVTTTTTTTTNTNGDSSGSGSSSTTATIPVSYTVLLGPQYYVNFYAADDSLVISMIRETFTPEATDEGEVFDPRVGRGGGFPITTTVLFHLKIVHQDEDASTTTTTTPEEVATTRTELYTFGVTEGRLGHYYGIDIQEGTDLRIATTVQHSNPFDLVWQVCGDNHYNDDTCITDDNWQQCFDLAIEGCADIVMSGGCPYTTFECNDELVSSTENYVIVYDITQPGTMMERGRVKIGEPHEVIQSVRFTKDFSYAVTFDLRDPFYVLQLPVGEAPSVEGSVKLEGFSSYLHPMNDEHTLLLGIGQNVTGEGLEQRTAGLMISVFDVTDTNSPQVVASATVMRDENTTTEELDVTSMAQWETKSVTYKDGKLVLPITFYDYETGYEIFNGFFVFDVGTSVNTGTITELYRINHIPMSEENGGEDDMMMTDENRNNDDDNTNNGNWQEEISRERCYYCHDMDFFSSSRSFIYDDEGDGGTLMTIAQTLVLNSNLETGNEIWSINLAPEDQAERKCCPYYRPR